jgi:predicted  nucleic acid-binding Zn-ribbon protein
MVATTTGIEKINLEAHVELCAERYKSLEEKLDQVDQRISTLETHVLSIKEGINSKTAGINKQLLAIATTIIGVLLNANITLIINLINK